MWFRDIDFPDALVEAHRAGTLVIFVGAGASRDAPSDLPDFRALTAAIAADAQADVTERDLAQPDVFLGELADREVDVHRMVAARLDMRSSKPNRLHEAIVDLAAASPALRIVTTNYDLHLSQILDVRRLHREEFTGPALPVGDEFEGLVYLHGSLRQDPRRLVVTDRDFGRAYLREAWAARFLERMFAEYTVLFIGYSHGDLVMRYLARGLRRGDRRYVLTPDPEAADWRRLGLRPIGYGVANDSHIALVESIAGWASQASMGLLDHRQRVAQIVSGPPPQAPEEASYLEALVADPGRVQLFVELARGREWLSWAAQQPEFRRLFEPSSAPSDCTTALSYWFAENFVTVEDLSAPALRVVQEAGGRLSMPAWSAIGHHVHMHTEPRPGWLSPWLVVLVETSPDTSHHWIEYALTASRWPEDRDAALLLFDHLTEPKATWQPSFSGDGPPLCDIALRGSQHWLEEAWRNLLLPNLSAAAPAVLAIADRHLRRARLLLVTAGSAGPGWDALSFRRSAVEPHAQDAHREAIDVLIDAARDGLKALLDADEGLGRVFLSGWADSDVPILRRLAVHGWTHRSDVDATTKIEWLRTRGWLWEIDLRHEVFHLIASAVPECDSSVADALVADMDAGPTAEEDDEHRDYERFNALAWIVRHRPALESAQDALERLRVEHPDFAERPHPDLTSWSETGWVRPQPPMTTDELHERIGEDASAAVHELRRYEFTNGPFEGPTWRDALAVLSDAVKTHPHDGVAVLDGDHGSHPEVAGAVIDGWSGATVDAAVAEMVLTRLASMDLRPVAHETARLLGEGGQNESNPTEWHRFAEARHLAEVLWAALESNPLPRDEDDWLGRAINHPAGRLAEFWVHAIAVDWRASGEDWAGLNPEIRLQLEALLDGDDDRTAMVEVVFASQAQFFFGADRSWWEAHVLPLLDWGNEDRARRTWDGFLAWGRWNDHMLSAGLLPNYIAAAAHVDRFGERSCRQLCRHLAGVALTSDLAPLEWIKQFTSTVDIDVRAEWMRQVAWILDDLPPDAVEHQWKRWMRGYWQDRLGSIPRELTDEEASAMAEWVAHLTESIEEGVDLVAAHPAGLDEHGHLLRQLDENRLQSAPVAFARFVEHLLTHTTTPFWGCHELRKTIRHLRDEPNAVDITGIMEQALRLGCISVDEW